MRHISDAQRRARLAVRHALAPAHHVRTPEEVTDALTVLHATEPATVHLACWARAEGLDIAAVDRALYTDRTLVKQLAMRRTLFVFPRELLPAVWPSASARVAATEGARTAKDAELAGLTADGADWLRRARTEVLAALADAPKGLLAAEVRGTVPMVDEKLELRGASTSFGARLLVQLGASGDIVRGHNTSRWTVSRPRWTLTRHWLGEVPDALDAAAGYRELVRRWLYTFGPGTEDDIVWWFGATKTAIRAALVELGAVTVSLEHDRTGWLLPDDLDDTAEVGPWVALLPVLDPTVMGWRHREFYLGPYREQLFDRQGNAGTTAWVDGRIVGCWSQDDAGVVSVHPLERIPAGPRRALDAEAARLTEWLGGLRINSVYKAPVLAS